MKQTMWVELNAANCKIVRVDDHNGSVAAIQVKHAALKRPLWFIKSQAGNWYWRSARREGDACADGYIVKGELDQAAIDNAARYGH